MSKYKVIKEFVMNGVLYKADSIIELNHQQESLKSIQDNIEKVVPNAPVLPPEPIVPIVEIPPAPEVPMPGAFTSTPTTPPPIDTMRYIVKEAFELDDVRKEVGTVIELSDKKAIELSDKIDKAMEVEM